tara:strand:- start:1905 stop:2183 length:279 start_codon:yes stop_codon:yes gene_type:complete
MGKKKRLLYKSKKLGKKYSSHPRARAEETQPAPIVETAEIPTKEEKTVEAPAAPEVEATKEAPKPKRKRRTTRKSPAAPKRKVTKPKAKEEE